MHQDRKFIVWVNYGIEGWSIYGASDDWDEILSIRQDALESSSICDNDIIVTENKNQTFKKRELVQMTEWHKELEVALLTLDDCQVECDGMTWAISHLLGEAGVEHDCMYGFVRNEKNKDIVAPHFWILLNDGWIIDFRLRMWLGDSDTIPHGIFHPGNEPNFQYKGDSVQNSKEMRLRKRVLDIMTDGKLSHVKVPQVQ